MKLNISPTLSLDVDTFVTSTQAIVAVKAGYAADGGGFNNALSRLRTLELIEGKAKLKASDQLHEGARA